MCISQNTSRDRAQQIVSLLRVARRDVSRLESWENDQKKVEAVDTALAKISDAIKAAQDLKKAFSAPPTEQTQTIPNVVTA